MPALRDRPSQRSSTARRRPRRGESKTVLRSPQPRVMSAPDQARGEETAQRAGNGALRSHGRPASAAPEIARGGHDRQRCARRDRGGSCPVSTIITLLAIAAHRFGHAHAGFPHREKLALRAVEQAEHTGVIPRPPREQHAADGERTRDRDHGAPSTSGSHSRADATTTRPEASSGKRECRDGRDRHRQVVQPRVEAKHDEHARNDQIASRRDVASRRTPRDK